MRKLTTIMATCVFCVPVAYGATTMKRYYAYDAVHDQYGVIAPWYKEQNGQCDFRVRIAAETLKRYPWTDAEKAAAPVPKYVFSGSWSITPDGTIKVSDQLRDWANGDLGQRAGYVLSGLVDYYRYSGDPAAIAHMTTMVDVLLDHCLTPADHPWPNFLVSVPVRGKAYGQCDPHGFIQLDIVAEVGLPLVRASQITGNTRWWEAAKHWGDVLAEKCDDQPGVPPWSRYANPQDVPWEDPQTGGVAYILDFLDALIRAGYTGKDNQIVKARDAGVAYLRDVLLPDWIVNDTWGRNFWDWSCHAQVETPTEYASRYLMTHPEEFPNWRTDVRNIISLYLNRTGVNPASNGDVYSGAWAYPESWGCCTRSLVYAPRELANVYAQYGVLADSEWGRELARRQIILATYDSTETGYVEDNIDKGRIVAGGWFKIAHPMAMKDVLTTMAWLPEVLGASRENHIMRSSGTVVSVVYGDGNITYSTYDAPANTVDVLRLAFQPTSLSADGNILTQRTDSKENGYQIKQLPDGDCIVTVRHDGAKNIVIRGDDPQVCANQDAFTFTGNWNANGEQRTAYDADAAMTYTFTGNQVRLIASVSPTGGLADVYVDDVKQLVGIDYWNPVPRDHQVLYYMNGLPDGKHTLKIVAQGAKNPLSKGTNVLVEGIQYSTATPKTGRAQFGQGGGPTGAQRFVFGYPGRSDYIDSSGNPWRPGTEFIIRLGHGKDSVEGSWWTQRRRMQIDDTNDPELYRYGIHGREFWVDFTVGPGTYYARLKFAETRNNNPKYRAVTVHVNGQERVADMDIAATAAQVATATQLSLAGPTGDRKVWAGLNRAVDLVFNDIRSQNGIISIRFTNYYGGEAIVQAIEVAPGNGGQGAEPISIAIDPAKRKSMVELSESKSGNLLRNGGFEEGVTSHTGRLGKNGGGQGWAYVFAGPGQFRVQPESGHGMKPKPAPPVLNSGTEAMRVYADGGGHATVSQAIRAIPNTKYTAVAWVRTANLKGKGFGTNSGDSAGFWIQEYSRALPSVCVDHPKQAVTKAGEYTKLSYTFTTSNRTIDLRFILDTVMACPFAEGYVTYDDCVLAPAASVK